jgi:hypothetical protein
VARGSQPRAWSFVKAGLLKTGPRSPSGFCFREGEEPVAVRATDDLDGRLAAHRAGRGSPLVAAAVRAGPRPGGSKMAKDKRTLSD